MSELTGRPARNDGRRAGGGLLREPSVSLIYNLQFSGRGACGLASRREGPRALQPRVGDDRPGSSWYGRRPSRAPVLWPGLGCRPCSPHQPGAHRTPVSRLQFSQEHLREPWKSGHPALALPQRPSRRGTALLRGCLPVSPSPAGGPAPPHHMVPHLWGVRCPPTSSTGAQTLAQPGHSVPWRSSLRPREVEAVGQLLWLCSGARGSGVTRAVPLSQEGAGGSRGHTSGSSHQTPVGGSVSSPKFNERLSTRRSLRE